MSGIHSAHQINNLLSAFAPVNMSCLLMNHGRMGCQCIILRHPCNCALFQSVNRFQKQCCACHRHFIMQILKIICRKNLHFHFQKHIPRIHALCHEHCGNARYLLTVNNGALHRCRPSVFRQKRAMHIDTAIFRHIQNFLRQNLPECSNGNQIRAIAAQLFDNLRFAYLHRLQNRNPMLQCHCLYGCGL